MTVKDVLEQYFTEDDLAQILGVEPHTVCKRRQLGAGHPPFIKLGRRILYPKADFAVWIKSQKKKSEATSFALRRVK